MSEIEERINRIADGLRRAAEERRLVAFPELFGWAKLAPSDPRHLAYSACEAAAALLGDRKEIAYEALLAKRGTDLPGGGFFDALHTNRREDFIALVGDIDPRDLTDEQKMEIVDQERDRVFQDAQRKRGQR
ncbi:hypothetical protein E0H46_38625 [Rhizobium leguminosarum bv. viciae]|nr:hypothetical protein E0H46_38625 [Rhizobium leguminosarum bv. viciae]